MRANYTYKKLLKYFKEKGLTSKDLYASYRKYKTNLKFSVVKEAENLDINYKFLLEYLKIREQREYIKKFGEEAWLKMKRMRNRRKKYDK